MTLIIKGKARVDDQLNETTILWRYLDTAKFLDLIHNQRLFFIRGDQLEDKFEGAFTTSIRQAIANRRMRGLDRAHIGTTLRDPFVDYAKVAEGMGVHGIGPITDPKDLGPALARAVPIVKSGQPVLIDVVTQGR